MSELRYQNKLVFPSLLLLFFILSANCAIRPPNKDSPNDLKTQKQDMVIQINKVRDNFNRNLSKLYLDEILNTLAQSHSMDMVQRKFFDHTNPNGKSSSDRAKQAGFNYEISQNIGKGNSLKQIHEGLMKSVQHYKNTIRPEWTRCGVGIYQDDQGIYYVTITFSSRDLKLNPVTQNQLIKTQNIISKYILDNNKQLKQEDKIMSLMIKNWYASGPSQTNTINQFIKKSKYNTGPYIISKSKLNWSDYLRDKLVKSKLFKQNDLNVQRFGAYLRLTGITLQITVVYTFK